MNECIKTRRGTPKKRTYLYKLGNEYAAITGGWVAVKEGGNSANGVTTKNVENLYLSAPAGSTWCYAEFYTNNTINLTQYTKLKCIVTVESTSTPSLSVCAKDTKLYTSGNVGASISVTVKAIDLVVELDITNVNQAEYIGFVAKGLSTNPNQTTATIKQVWLEE